MENKNFNILIFILYRINNMPITKSFVATVVVCGIMIGFFSFFSWILFFSDVPGGGFIFLALVVLCSNHHQSLSKPKLGFDRQKGLR